MFDVNAEIPAGPIMAAENPAPFVREMRRLLGDPNTDPGKYPQDFDLRHLGEQDLTTGRILALDTPETIYSGKQWLADQQLLEEARRRNQP